MVMSPERQLDFPTPKNRHKRGHSSSAQAATDWFTDCQEMTSILSALLLATMEDDDAFWAPSRVTIEVSE